jgi:hypothetical protein
MCQPAWDRGSDAISILLAKSDGESEKTGEGAGARRCDGSAHAPAGQPDEVESGRGVAGEPSPVRCSGRGAAQSCAPPRTSWLPRQLARHRGRRSPRSVVTVAPWPGWSSRAGVRTAIPCDRTRASATSRLRRSPCSGRRRPPPQPWPQSPPCAGSCRHAALTLKHARSGRLRSHAGCGLRARHDRGIWIRRGNGRRPAHGHRRRGA